jgi:hypothetical protein
MIFNEIGKECEIVTTAMNHILTSVAGTAYPSGALEITPYFY